MNNLQMEEPIFLEQGNEVHIAATALVDFIKGATESLHIAIYDFQLEGETKNMVVNAIKQMADKGVKIKIAYDHTKANDEKTIKGGEEGDPALRGTQTFINTNFQAGDNLQTEPIAGSHLMHNKNISYVMEVPICGRIKISFVPV